MPIIGNSTVDAPVFSETNNSDDNDALELDDDVLTSKKRRRRRRRKDNAVLKEDGGINNSSYLQDHFEGIRDISSEFGRIQECLKSLHVKDHPSVSNKTPKDSTKKIVKSGNKNKTETSIIIESNSSLTVNIPSNVANNEPLFKKGRNAKKKEKYKKMIDGTLTENVTTTNPLCNVRNYPKTHREGGTANNKYYDMEFRQLDKNMLVRPQTGSHLVHSVTHPTYPLPSVFYLQDDARSLNRNAFYYGNQNNVNACSPNARKLWNPMTNNFGTPPSQKYRQPSAGSPKKTKTTEKNSNEDTTFETYMFAEDVMKQLDDGTLIQGSIRINPRNFKESYVTNPKKAEQDIIIESLRERNRALEGDVVVIQLKPEAQWRGGDRSQKTAKVVFIKERVHSRTTIGYLKLMPDANRKLAAFTPRDSRVPRIRIPFTDWPPLFYQEASKYQNILFLVRITEWTDTRYALGNIIENVGLSGDIKVETKAILLENGLDVTPYSPNMNKYFPATGEIAATEYEYREDLRKQCIFTIDPLTARDLDDAVSCRQLENGNLEIGVHISDVAFYLEEGTELDKIVSQKATTVYMVESVYHMLPKELCMLCSLLPGEDKLAFSVFWEMTPEGVIKSHRFARTIINSCTQLAYEHAQMMLENPEKKIQKDELPEIFGGFGPDQLATTVRRLQKIAVNLRAGRFEAGALRIDQPKLMFQLDPNTCLPNTFSVYVNQESHRLIEEFMLLANITVATKLHTEYPELAFLRSHPPPHEHMMVGLQRTFEKVGIHLDVSSAGSLQKSMLKYVGEDPISQARMLVINAICAKPMTRAKYFCAATASNEKDLWHYALNIPLYTHFTSPIRRYADVMVHRLLAATIGYTQPVDWIVDDVSEIAGVCNKQKYNAKKAGEQSSELYLTKYIEASQPVLANAVVLDVKDKSFDISVLSMGINVRIYKNNLTPATILKETTEVGLTTLTLQWPATPELPHRLQYIEIFAMILVQMTVSKTSKKIEAKLLPPSPTQ